MAESSAVTAVEDPSNLIRLEPAKGDDESKHPPV